MHEEEILKFLRKINDNEYRNLSMMIHLLNKEKKEVQEFLNQLTTLGYIDHSINMDRWTISFRGKIKAEERIARRFKQLSIKKGLQQVSLNAKELNDLEEFFISVKGIKIDSLKKIPEKSSKMTLIYAIQVEEKDQFNFYQLASNWAYQQNYSYSNTVDMIQFPYKFVGNKLKSGSHMFTFKQVEEEEYLSNSGLKIFS